jgi:hypothetical protein
MQMYSISIFFKKIQDWLDGKWNDRFNESLDKNYNNIFQIINNDITRTNTEIDYYVDVLSLHPEDESTKKFIDLLNTRIILLLEHRENIIYLYYRERIEVDMT